MERRVVKALRGIIANVVIVDAMYVSGLRYLIFGLLLTLVSFSAHLTFLNPMTHVEKRFSKGALSPRPLTAQCYCSGNCCRCDGVRE